MANGRLGHRPGLDAMRGAAALAVVIAHAGPGPYNAAATGVTAFFVLSGFLITFGLLERAQSPERSFAAFYERRARRLLPALVPVIAVGTVFHALWWPEVSSAWTVPAALGFQLNWLQMSGEPVGVFGALWSLSVEEHFYLLWPAVVWLTPRRHLPAILVAVLVGSLTLGALLPVGELTKYFATPFRLGELAMGALCALAFHTAGDRISVPTRWAVVGMGGLSLAALIPRGMDYVPVGPLLGGLGAAATLLHLLHHPGWPPLRWVGRKSYAVYLWHVPVQVGLERAGLSSWEVLAVSLPLTLALATASWHWVEEPWLRPSRVPDASCPTLPAETPTETVAIGEPSGAGGRGGTHPTVGGGGPTM